MAEPEHSDDLQLALRMADEADRISMLGFTGSPLHFSTKDDGSPVTESDRAIERRLRLMVGDERTDDGFLGEEVGESGPRDRRWIVDGIDGTVAFVAGGRGWGTQIALERSGQMVAAVSTSPALGRRWWASRGGGAWTSRTGRAQAVRLAVTEHPSMADFTYSSTPPLNVLPRPRRTVVEAFGASGRYVEPEHHCALMVAEGLVDAGVQPGGGPWDFAALTLIVEEAGGSFSDIAGKADIYNGGPCLYSNGKIHAEGLTHLASSAVT